MRQISEALNPPCRTCGYGEDAAVHLPRDKPYDHQYQPMTEYSAEQVRMLRKNWSEAS